MCPLERLAECTAGKGIPAAGGLQALDPDAAAEAVAADASGRACRWATAALDHACDECDASARTFAQGFARAARGVVETLSLAQKQVRGAVLGSREQDGLMAERTTLDSVLRFRSEPSSGAVTSAAAGGSEQDLDIDSVARWMCGTGCDAPSDLPATGTQSGEHQRFANVPQSPPASLQGLVDDLLLAADLGAGAVLDACGRLREARG